MSIFGGDASDVYRLADDLAQVAAKTVPTLRAAMKESGDQLASKWASNARATSGTHGKHYPNSIDAELTFNLTGVSVDVGPNSSKKQGRMGKGFEFGSRNQPPHLDGVRALAEIEPRVSKIIDAAVTFP